MNIARAKRARENVTIRLRYSPTWKDALRELLDGGYLLSIDGVRYFLDRYELVGDYMEATVRRPSEDLAPGL